MEIQKNIRQNPVIEEHDIYTFKREDGVWYIHLPDKAEHGWDKRGLRMEEGAHKFLDMLSNGAQMLRLRMGIHPFERSDKLELVSHCTTPKGGAIYLFTPAHNAAANALFWICDLALFVFGDMPECIYLQRLRIKTNQFH